MNILLVFGTRPEAIKMAPVADFLRKSGMKISICVTGQHKEMLNQVLEVFQLRPDYDLSVMKENQTLNQVASKVIKGVAEILGSKKYQWVIVQGDTTTTVATALSAFYSNVKVAHIEAGLRTHNLNSPFPEEGNRQLTSRISTLHFAPTDSCKDNLLKEGIESAAISVTGNTVIDSLKWVLQNTGSTKLDLNFDLSKDFLLVTSHRRENFGQGIIGLCNALQIIALNRPNLEIVYPVHLNPNVYEPVHKMLSGFQNIHLLPPLNYIEFVHLMNKSKAVLTDSGGIQEEAPALGKPVLLMRDSTERPEAVNAGNCKVVGTDSIEISRSVFELLDDPAVYKRMSRINNIYGDGKASERIFQRLNSYDKID
jgi:UDP-N-acetylglucosamine 2-epimerase (non-hydrolysing)